MGDAPEKARRLSGRKEHPLRLRRRRHGEAVGSSDLKVLWEGMQNSRKPSKNERSAKKDQHRVQRKTAFSKRNTEVGEKKEVFKHLDEKGHT